MEKETIEFLKELENKMISNGFNTLSLSNKIGVSDTTIGRMFKLESKPNFDLIVKVMKELDIKSISV